MAQYDALLLEQLQALWGSGFLSPGGREEVRLIVEGLDLAGKTVLDIGTGLGGPALVLAGECDAQVTGLDVQAEILAEARERITAAGLDQQITLQLTTPGPLPLADAEADVVFSKDSLIHVPDKPTIYAEMFRVLRPGGALAISDWLTGPAEDPDVMAFIE
ncbi:MAG: methyltransferase domain-containing protein, partial [Pseudomonadota bacterium]